MRDEAVIEGGDPACWAHHFAGPERDLEDRVDIEVLVRDFYRQAAMDDVLGPVFQAARVHWPEHIATLTDFWAWQLFGERTYTGNPIRAHEDAHERTPLGAEHYERWLELFESTVDERYEGPIAERAKDRARKMASAMRRLLEGRSDPGSEPVAVTFTRLAPRVVD